MDSLSSITSAAWSDLDQPEEYFSPEDSHQHTKEADFEFSDSESRSLYSGGTISTVESFRYTAKRGPSLAEKPDIDPVEYFANLPSLFSNQVPRSAQSGRRRRAPRRALKMAAADDTEALLGDVGARARSAPCRRRHPEHVTMREALGHADFHDWGFSRLSALCQAPDVEDEILHGIEFHAGRIYDAHPLQFYDPRSYDLRNYTSRNHGFRRRRMHPVLPPLGVLALEDDAALERAVAIGAAEREGRL